MDAVTGVEQEQLQVVVDFRPVRRAEKFGAEKLQVKGQALPDAFDFFFGVFGRGGGIGEVGGKGHGFLAGAFCLGTLY